MFKQILVSLILLVSMLTQVVNATVTVLPIPTPTQTNIAGEFGQVQGMITAVSSRYVIINTTTVTFDGDTTINYNGGLNSLSIGEIVNYSYTVDVDGVILATVMDVYPAEAITSTDRVSRIDVDNSTAIVALTLYRGPIVDFYQHSGIYVQFAGTQTSFGCQLVNYTGYINPTTGHIIASGWGYMSDIPVNFISPASNLTVGTAMNFYSIDISQYGMPCLLGVGATGLPPGLTNNNGLISGTPTTPGTYTVTMNAMYGDHNVNSYSSTSGIITIVVDSGSVLPPPPPPTPVDNTAPVITENGGDVTLTVGDTYADAGATCTDNIDATCTVNVSSTVDTTTTGTYIVTYSATDAAGNTSTATRTVTVNPAPVVVVPCSGIDQVITNAANARGGIVEIGGGPSNGGIAVQIFQASTTIVAPLTASTFFKAGNLISYVGTMDVNNLCITTSATVSAPADTTAPVITLNGGDVTLTVGDVYTDAGATANDAVDGTVTVTTTNNVDTTTVGTYTVNYSATDAAGNSSTATRTVTVKAPVIVPPTTSTGIVSTGIKVEGTNKIITAVTATTINIGSLIIRITPTTTIKLNKNKPLKVGDRIEYKGTKNTDGSITATSVKIQ